MPHGDDSQLLLSTTNRAEVIVGTLWPKRADTFRMAANTYNQSEIPMIRDYSAATMNVTFELIKLASIAIR